jgi:hypothetical protein
MKLFSCQNCARIVYFENDHCENCQTRLGYLPDLQTLSAITPSGDAFLAMADPEGRYRPCANAEHEACNWMVRSDEPGAFCVACRHNRTVPDLSVEENLHRWRKIELAKHHLFYTLLRLGLRPANREDAPDSGLAFDFLSDAGEIAAPVLTGHDHGLITLNLIEADDGEREQIRQKMGEPYRTLLGHLRHEVGHYFWEELVERGDRAAAFRACFGDERTDYAAALQAYYTNGPTMDWQSNFVSAYASSHPWEDFAETWAHYFHIVDTLEMAGAFGLRVRPNVPASVSPEAELDAAAAELDDINALIDLWLPVTFAVNSINRCMGQPDLYPFILTPSVIAKLGFIHDLVHGRLPTKGMHGVPAIT